MRRDQPSTPFDVEADELTQEFWGASKGWISSEQPRVRRQRTAGASDTTGSLRAIREGFAAFRPQTAPTGEVRRQRQHGRSTTDLRSDLGANDLGGSDRSWRDDRREATLGELAAGRSDVGGWFDDPVDDAFDGRATRSRRDGTGVERHDAERHDAERREMHDEVRETAPEGWWDDAEPEYDVPLSPVQPLVERLGLGAVDPLLVRAGAIALALILLVPVMLSLRPDRADGSLPGDVVEAPQPAAGAAPASPELEPDSTGETGGVTAADAEVATAATQDSSTLVDTTVADTSTEPSTTVDAASDDAVSSSDSTERTSADATTDEAAAVDVAAERLVPACPQTYTAATGDSWYRIADEAGVDPDELLAENTATLATVILPGDDICLPEGARMPSPPSTTVASDDDEPVDESAPTTEAPPAPTTTVAPTVSLSRSEVQDLIRATWPEDEVDKALAVADRESDFIATADNGWCCVGVFQIYWTVHRGWLDDFGIYERSDLFDARKNVAAAYHMWQTQGWGPWGG